MCFVDLERAYNVSLGLSFWQEIKHVLCGVGLCWGCTLSPILFSWTEAQGAVAEWSLIQLGDLRLDNGKK